MVRSGSGTYDIDFETYEICADRLFWIAKGQVHAAYTCSDFSGQCISISEDFLLPIIHLVPYSKPLTEGTLRPSFVDGVSHSQVTALFEAVKNENDPFRTSVISAHLKLLCVDIVKQLGPQSGPLSGSSSVILTYRNLIDRHFTTAHSVEFYAEQLHLNANYLNELIMQSTGHPASYWIHDRIIREAKRLLFSTLNPISEIAAHLGFEDPSYFYRYFKRYTGTTPNAFRKTRP